MGKKRKSRRPPPRRKRPPSVTAAAQQASGTPVGKQPAAADGARLLRRMRSLQIAVVEDECPADRAVCGRPHAGDADAEWADDVHAVREAFQQIQAGNDRAAQVALQSIPRRSPLSQWRLFLSGLIQWYDGNRDAAEATWQRLDPSRRPARIAAVLRHASSKTAPSARGDESASPPGEAGLERSVIESRGSIVHSLRFERPALKELAEATNRRAPAKEGDKFPLRLVEWLRSWRSTHRRLEPNLVARVERNALALAFEQPHIPVFEQLSKIIPGPVHDPKNRWYHAQYLDKFLGAEEEAEQLREKYLQEDLANASALNEPTRAALESLIHLRIARENLHIGSSGLFMEPAPQEDVEGAFRASIKAYPKNRDAHREYVQFLQEPVGYFRESKEEEEKRLTQVRRAMERWAKSLPDDVEPRLWLVNYYLDREQSDAASPHVEMLQGQRFEDPRIRSLPWRCAFFESMRLARHKRRVPQAREQLERAESLWPEWLSRQWLPFLNAALAWRAGRMAEFERERSVAEADVEGPLLTTIMLFAAARRMHVPSGELKPLREQIEALLARPTQITWEDLLRTGSFLWDLDRTELLYTGYRKHGPRLVELLTERLDQTNAQLPDEPLGPAVLWAAGHRFGGNRYEAELPAVVIQRAKTDPLVAASVLRVATSMRWKSRLDAIESGARQVVADAVDVERDPFYRHYFQNLLTETARWAEEPGPSGPFERGQQEDDDDEELCYCDACRRERGELDDDELDLDAYDDELEDLFEPDFGVSSLEEFAAADPDALARAVEEIAPQVGPQILEALEQLIAEAQSSGGGSPSRKKKKSKKSG